MVIYEIDVFIEFPYLTKHLCNQFKLIEHLPLLTA